MAENKEKKEDKTLIKSMSKKTQNNILTILIIIVVLYLSYSFYTASKIYKKSKQFYLGTAKTIMYDIAQTVTGKTKTEVADMKISEIYNKYILYNDKATLLNKKDYERVYKWFIQNQKESDNNIDEMMQKSLNYSMNNLKTIFTKILY